MRGFPVVDGRRLIPTGPAPRVVPLHLAANRKVASTFGARDGRRFRARIRNFRLYKYDFYVNCCIYIRQQAECPME